MMWEYGWGWGSWLGMGVAMILFWGLIIAGIIAIVRYVGSARDASRSINGQAHPEDVPAERFALPGHHASGMYTELDVR